MTSGRLLKAHVIHSSHFDTLSVRVNNFNSLTSS